MVTKSPKPFFFIEGPSKIVQFGWTPGRGLILYGAGPVQEVVKLEGEDALRLDFVAKLDD